MKKFKTHCNETFVLSNDGVLLSVGHREHLNQIFELKFSDEQVENFKRGFLLSWISDLIQEISLNLPCNELEFEDFIKRRWGTWLIQGWVIEKEFNSTYETIYKFDEKYMAHDMREYYGLKSKRSGLFRKRWEICFPKVQVKFKEHDMEIC